MWLSILIVAGLIGGIIGALMGMGPIAIILILMGLIGLAAKVMGGAGGGGNPGAASSGNTLSSTGGRVTDERPQDTENLPTAHVETGAAHEGQQRMTPDQERLPG